MITTSANMHLKVGKMDGIMQLGNIRQWLTLGSGQHSAMLKLCGIWPAACSQHNITFTQLKGTVRVIILHFQTYVTKTFLCVCFEHFIGNYTRFNK